jgi:hypothetical protein
MRVSEINEAICIGDTVIDKMDDDAVRTISHFENHGDNTASVFMTDGGVMALSEIVWNDEAPSTTPFTTIEDSSGYCVACSTSHPAGYVCYI